MTTPTISQLVDIFYSGQYRFLSDKSLLVKLRFLIENNYISYTKLEIATKQEYLQVLKNTIWLKENYDASGGSVEHVALKLLSEKYLDKFGLAVKFEQPFYGYYPDVITDDKQTIVECGHTDNVDKIYTYFLQGKIANLIQLPYPNDNDKILFGHEFTPQKDLFNFLSFEQETEISLLKSIINRKRS